MAAMNRAMVFAAGRGTRMQTLTQDRPKPLIEVAGKTLLDHALDLLVEAGISDVVVNTHYLGDQIADHVATREVPNIHVSPEKDLLETGGGLKAAQALLGNDPVVTLNADAVWKGANPVEIPCARVADRLWLRHQQQPRAPGDGNTGAQQGFNRVRPVPDRIGIHCHNRVILSR